MPALRIFLVLTLPVRIGSRQSNPTQNGQKTQHTFSAKSLNLSRSAVCVKPMHTPRIIVLGDIRL